MKYKNNKNTRSDVKNKIMFIYWRGEKSATKGIIQKLKKAKYNIGGNEPKWL